MPINPSIAMGYQVPQLENPLNQYAKVAGIQNAQNQNALAQFQLATAQREQTSANALNEAYKNAFNPATGQIDKNKLISSLASGGAGRQIPGIQKQFAEQEESELKRGKAQADLVGEHMKLSRQGLEGVTTPEQYIAWHEANHRDPVLQKYFASRGLTAEQARKNIMQKLSQPGGFEQLLNESKLGAEKAMEQHFAQVDTGGQISTIAIPRFGTGAARTVPGSQAAKVMSPEAAARLAQEKENAAQGVTYQVDELGNIVALPTKVKPGAPVVGRPAVGAEGKPLVSGGKPLTDAQSKAALFGTRMQESNKIFDMLEKAGTTTSIPGSRSKMGVGEVISALSPAEQQQLDQAKRDFVNAVLRRESGAVISDSEFANAEKQYFPQIGDSPKVIAQKKQNRLVAQRGVLAEVPKGVRDSLVSEISGQKLTGQDKEAMDWANANPKDPRAAKIKERLGVQ